MRITSRVWIWRLPFVPSRCWRTWLGTPTADSWRSVQEVGRELRRATLQTVGEVVRAISAVDQAISSSDSTTNNGSPATNGTPVAGDTSSRSRTNRHYVYFGLLGLLLTGNVQFATVCMDTALSTESLPYTTRVLKECSWTLRVPLLTSINSASGSLTK